MKIVVLDGYTENPGDLSWGDLEKLGELKVYDRVSYEESPVIAEPFLLQATMLWITTMRERRKFRS